MKSQHAIIALVSALGVAAAGAGACSGAGSGNHGVEPDAMLPNPEDVTGSQDATDGTLGLFTFLRIGQLVPELGPVSVCYLAPGSATWSPLFGPPMAVDGGAEAEAEAETEGGAEAGADATTDGPSEGARRDVAPDALVEVSSREGSMVDGAPKLDVATPIDAPLDAQGADADAGISRTHIDPLTLSRYLRIDGAGTFQLAILPAGTGSCTGGYFTQAVTLDSDKYTTIVLAQTRAGVLGPAKSYLGGGPDVTLPFGLLTFTDELGTVLSSARTRFIDAVLPAPPDAGGVPLSAAVLDTTADLVPLANVIAPDRTTAPSQAPPAVDALGYHDSDPMEGFLALRVGPAGDGGTLPWTSAAGDLGLRAGSSHTAFILSAPSSQYRVLWCNDLSQQSVLTDCVVIGQ